MCLLILAVIVLVAVLSAVWPYVLGLFVVCVIANIWFRVAHQVQVTREADAARRLAEYRRAAAFWQAQLAEVDTPVARKTAADLAAYNQARLSELEPKKTGSLT